MTRMCRMLLLGALLALIVPAGAAAKEISAAKVCGQSECTDVRDRELATMLAGGGPPTSLPERAAPWYRSTLTVRAEDGGEVFTDRFNVAVVPSARLMRGEDGTWMSMPPETVRAYAKVIGAIEPRPARTLPGAGADWEPPPARVDEVFNPAASADAHAADGGPSAWTVGLTAAAAAALVVMAALIRRRRRIARHRPGDAAESAI